MPSGKVSVDRIKHTDYINKEKNIRKKELLENKRNKGKDPRQKRQQEEEKKDMSVQNSMPIKGKALKSYKNNAMQTAGNYFSFVMEITEVDFSILTYF